MFENVVKPSGSITGLLCALAVFCLTALPVLADSGTALVSVHAESGALAGDVTHPLRPGVAADKSVRLITGSSIDIGNGTYSFRKTDKGVRSQLYTKAYTKAYTTTIQDRKQPLFNTTFNIHRLITGFAPLQRTTALLSLAVFCLTALPVLAEPGTAAYPGIDNSIVHLLRPGVAADKNVRIITGSSINISNGTYSFSKTDLRLVKGVYINWANIWHV